MGNLVNTVMT